MAWAASLAGVGAFLLRRLPNAWVLGALSRIACLSFAPGGISEMSITASRLDLGVPLVVASHVVRPSILTLLAPYSFRLFSRLKTLAAPK